VGAFDEKKRSKKSRASVPLKGQGHDIRKD
jgi:hypothetical protein